MAFAASTYVDHEPCYQMNNGAVGVNASGGSGAYTYLWSNGLTTSIISSLQPGIYYVTVHDTMFNQTVNASIVLGEVSPFIIDFELNELAPNGQLTAIVTGGTGLFAGDLQYRWFYNGEFISDQPTISGLESGCYTLVVARTKTRCTAERTIYLPTKYEASILKFKCCAASLAFKYVQAMRDGLRDCAECALTKLTLIHGYIEDLCDYKEPGTEIKIGNTAESTIEIPGLPLYTSCGLQNTIDVFMELSIDGTPVAAYIDTVAPDADFLQAGIDNIVEQLMFAGYSVLLDGDSTDGWSIQILNTDGSHNEEGVNLEISVSSINCPRFDTGETGWQIPNTVDKGAELNVETRFAQYTYTWLEEDNCPNQDVQKIIEKGNMICQCECGCDDEKQVTSRLQELLYLN